MAGVRECCNEDEPFLWRLSPPPNSFTNHLHDNDHYGGGGCSAATAACAAGRCNAMSTSRYVQLHIYLSLFKSAMSLPWMAGVVCGGKSYYWHTHISHRELPFSTHKSSRPSRPRRPSPRHGWLASSRENGMCVPGTILHLLRV